VDRALIGNDGSGDSIGLCRGIQWATDQGAHVISMCGSIRSIGDVEAQN
jgi:hypothetical protein